jgi:hypothetical protein
LSCIDPSPALQGPKNKKAADQTPALLRNGLNGGFA